MVSLYVFTSIPSEYRSKKRVRACSYHRSVLRTSSSTECLAAGGVLRTALIERLLITQKSRRPIVFETARTAYCCGYRDWSKNFVGSSRLGVLGRGQGHAPSAVLSLSGESQHLNKLNSPHISLNSRNLLVKIHHKWIVLQLGHAQNLFCVFRSAPVWRAGVQSSATEEEGLLSIRTGGSSPGANIESTRPPGTLQEDLSPQRS